MLCFLGKVKGVSRGIAVVDSFTQAFWTILIRITARAWLAFFRTKKLDFFFSTFALSFYRSQNVLGWSKFFCQTKHIFTHCGSYKCFVPDKKMICIQLNWFLCLRKSFWRGNKCSQSFGLTQKIRTGTKHFGTSKRTRHFFLILPDIVQQQMNLITEAKKSWIQYKKWYSWILNLPLENHSKIYLW